MKKNALLLILILITAIPAAPVYAQTSTPTPSATPRAIPEEDPNYMLACWDFESNTEYQYDITGHGHTLQYAGVGGSDPAMGQAGFAVNFSGGSYTLISNPITYTLGVTQSITTMAWIKLDELTDGTDYVIYAKNSAGATSQLLFVDWDGSQHEFAYYASPDGTLDQSKYQISSTVVPELDTWYLIAGQYDHNTGNLSIWVNGITASRAREGVGISTAGTVVAVAREGNNTAQFKGTIDTLRVFGRALDETQIQSYYDNPEYNCSSEYTVYPSNVLGDGDMEQWPGSDYWLNITDSYGNWFGRKVDFLDWLWHGSPYCGRGYHHIDGPNSGNDAAIKQNFSWMGGRAYFRWYVRTNWALFPRPAGSYSVYIIDNFTGTPYVIHEGEPIGTTWTGISGSLDLQAGSYTIQFWSHGEGDDVYLDQVAISALGPVPEGCYQETVFPTTTPGGTMTPDPMTPDPLTQTVTGTVYQWPTFTPTTTASPTPTPTKLPLTINNCDFEAGAVGWSFGSGGVTDPGGPVGARYGFAGPITQNFYKSGANLYYTFWVRGSVDVRVVNTVTNYITYLTIGDYDSWSWSQGAYVMAAGSYRLELRNRPNGKYNYAHYDGITLGVNGFNTSSPCYSFPTPGPTQTKQPSSTATVTRTGTPATGTATPTGIATGTPYPSATLHSTWTPNPSYTPLPTSTPGTIYITTTPGTLVPFTTTPGSGTPVPGVLPTNWPVPPGVGPVTWNVSCARPQNVFDLAAWLDYETCEIKKYVSWGPPHSATMVAIPTVFSNKEPMGTLNEIGQGINEVNILVNAYSWSDTGIPGVNDIPAVDVYMGAKREDSPWNNGSINLQGASQYSTYCSFSLSEIVGSRLSTPMCFMFNILRNLAVLPWLQTFVNLFSLAALTIYLVRKWIDAGAGAK